MAREGSVEQLKNLTEQIFTMMSNANEKGLEKDDTIHQSLPPAASSRRQHHQPHQKVRHETARLNSTISVTKSECCVLAITGATNSGKTTMAQLFMKMLMDQNVTTRIVHQDDFFRSVEKPPTAPVQLEILIQPQDDPGNWLSRTVKKLFHGRVPADEKNEASFYYDYDSKDSVDVDSLVETVAEAIEENEYVIIEGNMLVEFPEVLELCDRIIVLTIDFTTCNRRRSKRTYEPPDSDGYFETVAWPAYLRHTKLAFSLARDDRRFSFVDVSSDSDIVNPQEIIDRIKMLSDDVIRITFEPLEVEETMRIINSPSCGATSVFVGTTRDTFQGRRVERLDYESYDEMAYKELRVLCDKVHSKFPTVERIVIFHRIGEVAVGDASVIIATASPHRKEAIDATEMAIDELKKSVPIWKKEIYADGGCSWKENGEFKTMKETELSTVEGSFSQALPNRDANRNLFHLRQFMKQVSLSDNRDSTV